MPNPQTVSAYTADDLTAMAEEMKDRWICQHGLDLDTCELVDWSIEVRNSTTRLIARVVCEEPEFSENLTMTL